MKKALLALAIATLITNRSALATNRWWDVNSTTAGSGANGTTNNWDTATTRWTTDSVNGTTATTGWTASDSAFFSAGTDGNGSFTVNVNGAQTVSGITVEEGTVNITGSALTLAGTPTISVANGAKFSIISSGALVTSSVGSVTLTGGTMENRNPSTSGSFMGSSTANTNLPIVLAAGGLGGHVSANGGAGIVTIYTGSISGTGPLSVDGTGIFRLTTTTATYSGATIINGQLQLSTTANVLPSGTDMTINSAGTFDDQASQTIASLTGAGNLAFTNSATILTVGGSTSPAALTGIVSGAGNLIRSGTGTLTLGGTSANTYTGTTSVTGGELDLNKTAGVNAIANGALTINGASAIVKLLASNQIGDGNALTVTLGTFNMNGNNETVATIAGAGNITNNNGTTGLTIAGTAATTFSGTIAGSAPFTKTAASTGISTLSGDSSGTFSGNVVVNGGRLSVQNNGALGNTTGNTQIASGAELLFTGATLSNVPEPIQIAGAGGTDNGAIAGIATSTVTLSGPVTLTADSTVTSSSGSALTFSNTNAFTTATSTNFNLTFAGTTTASSVSGNISLGTGGVTKSQGGTWALSGTNTYSGLTNITGGTLSVSNINNNLGQNTTVNIGSTTTGANLTYTGSGESTSKIINLAGTTGGAFLIQSGSTGNLQFTSDLTATGVGAKTLTLQGSTAGTGEIAGKIVDGAGTTSVAKSGSGTWTLSGNNSYTGSTTIGAGTLVASDIKNSGTNSNLGAGGSIAFGATTSTGTLKYTGTGDTSNRAIDLAGTTGGGTIDHSGTGLLKFTTNMTASGAGSKTLTLTGSTAPANGTGEIAGAIVDNSATNKTSLVKSGTGTWALTGTSSYTGTTTINAGVLQVNGSITGAGAVTVNSGGTLAGTGAVTGAVTVNSGGHLAPGLSPESLDMGALTFSGTSTFDYEINTTYNISLAAAADLVNANGNLSIAGTAILNLIELGSPTNVVQGNTKYTLISYAGTWDNGTFAGKPDDSIVSLGVNQYVINYNDITGGSNFGGGLYGNGIDPHFVTLTAIPEASSILFGGLVCVVLGVAAGGRKLLRRSVTTC